jgi:hypothetical protein
MNQRVHENRNRQRADTADSAKERKPDTTTTSSPIGLSGFPLAGKEMFRLCGDDEREKQRWAGRHTILVLIARSLSPAFACRFRSRWPRLRSLVAFVLCWIPRRISNGETGNAFATHHIIAHSCMLAIGARLPASGDRNARVGFGPLWRRLLLAINIHPLILAVWPIGARFHVNVHPLIVVGLHDVSPRSCPLKDIHTRLRLP